jgi:glucan phosphoethanolaminetransferase (alkaline phosphatase superfamily)
MTAAPGFFHNSPEFFVTPLRQFSRLILCYLIIHLLVSGLYMGLFIQRFALPQNTLALHALLLVSWHLLLVLLLRLSDKPWLRWLLVLGWAAYLIYLPLLYALNWFSNLNWGSNIMFDFVVHLPGQVYSISQTEGISLFWVLSLLLILVLLCLWLAHRLVMAVVLLLQQSAALKSFRAMGLMTTVVVFVGAYVGLTYSRTHPGQWVYEPLLSSVAVNSNEYRNSLSIRQALQDEKIQQRFEQTLSQVKRSKNVVLIIADALRADRLSVNGYHRTTTPHLEERAKKPGFQQVDTFTSTCSESICGIYSVLSSREYKHIGFDLYDLPDVLSSVGYRKNFILSSNHNYNALNQLYGEYFDHYIDGNDFPDPLTLHDDAGVVDYLQGLEPMTGEPAFFYFHLMSAHSLGKNRPEFSVFQPAVEHLLSWVGKTIDQDITEELKQLSNGYDNGVLQTDHYIEQILGLLESKGYLDDAVVIITGDHGDGLGENGYVSHTYHLYQEDIQVPLIWISDDCQLVNQRYGTQIDVAPTVLDCLDLPVPETWQGQSLMQPYTENRITHHQTLRTDQTIMSVLENRAHLYKLMANRQDGRISDLRLFDWYQDPEEQHNLIETADNPAVRQLKDAFSAYFEVPTIP